MSLFKEINTENKLRITVTYLAMSTLREDAADFGLKMATLVNRIIAYYSADAKASISVQVGKYERWLKDVLGKGSDDVLKKLVAAEEKELKENLPAYSDSPESLLFRVTNDNIFLLTEDPTTREDLYYPKHNHSCF